jgi:hypothetical protein
MALSRDVALARGAAIMLGIAYEWSKNWPLMSTIKDPEPEQVYSKKRKYTAEDIRPLERS